MLNSRSAKITTGIVALAAAFSLGFLLGGPARSAAHDDAGDPQSGAEQTSDAHAGHDHAGQMHGDNAHGDHASAGNNPRNWEAVNKMHLYLCAFHVAKNNPKFQVEAHHYCSPTGDFHQCVVYDSNSTGAKLLGVEYLITDEQYQTLPSEEKKYWHPHPYEIISGQLVAPDMPDQGDKLLSGLIATWGKTWHTWADPTTKFPMGKPLLMWSANGDDQIDTGLVSKRDAQFGISTQAIRQRRKSLGYAAPQIPPPRSLNDHGRLWTAQGEDKPVRLNASGS